MASVGNDKLGQRLLQIKEELETLRTQRAELLGRKALLNS